MKTSVITFALLAIISTAAMAEDKAMTAPAAATTPAPAAMNAMPAAAAAPAVMADKTLTGTVKSVSMADAVKGTKTEIVVADADGKTTSILVKATTTLYDADAKAITLDKIAADAKVSVMYTTSAEGINEAKSVKIVK